MNLELIIYIISFITKKERTEMQQLIYLQKVIQLVNNKRKSVDMQKVHSSSM
jgi:hypothetical protein